MKRISPRFSSAVPLKKTHKNFSTHSLFFFFHHLPPYVPSSSSSSPSECPGINCHCTAQSITARTRWSWPAPARRAVVVFGGAATEVQNSYQIQRVAAVAIAGRSRRVEDGGEEVES